MNTPHLGKNFKVATVVIFLFMILSRMTWMQIRQDTLKRGGFLSPDLPWSSFLGSEIWISWNVAMVFVTLFFVLLIVRFLTSSWPIALFSGTVLMSRGAIMARVTWYSLDLTMSLIASAWFCCLAHHMRTASPTSLFLSWLSLLLGAALDPAFIFLGLLLPLFTFLVKFLRQQRLGTYLSGSVFRTLGVSYASWLKSSATGKRYAWMACLGIVALMGLWSVTEFPAISDWGQARFYGTEITILDLHYLLSASVILVSSILAFVRDDNFLHFQTLFVGAVLLWVAGSILLHKGPWLPQAPLAILMWVEPLVLGLAAAGGIKLLSRPLPSRQVALRNSEGEGGDRALNELTEDN